MCTSYGSDILRYFKRTSPRTATFRNSTLWLQIREPRQYVSEQFGRPTGDWLNLTQNTSLSSSCRQALKPTTMTCEPHSGQLLNISTISVIILAEYTVSIDDVVAHFHGRTYIAYTLNSQRCCYCSHRHCSWDAASADINPASQKEHPIHCSWRLPLTNVIQLSPTIRWLYFSTFVCHSDLINKTSHHRRTYFVLTPE